MKVVDSHLRHAAGPTTAGARLRPGGALRDQVHRRAQRRHPRSSCGEPGAHRLGVGVRGAPGRGCESLRGRWRDPRTAYPRRASATSERGGARRSPRPWKPTSASPRCATRDLRPIPSTSWPYVRWISWADSSPSTSRTASMPGARWWSRPSICRLATSLGGPETLVTHPGLDHARQPAARRARSGGHRSGNHPDVRRSRGRHRPASGSRRRAGCGERQALTPPASHALDSRT